jgi:hypothetical protein
MTKLMLTIALAFVSTAAFAAKSCDELKNEIEAKLKAKGVAAFTLEVVAADAQSDGKVVGTCEAGQKKIIYKRG